MESLDLVARFKDSSMLAADNFVESGDDSREMLLPEGHLLVGLNEAFRRSLAPPATRPMDADPMGPMPQDPAWASGGNDRPVLAKVVDAIKDVLTGS